MICSSNHTARTFTVQFHFSVIQTYWRSVQSGFGHLAICWTVFHIVSIILKFFAILRIHIARFVPCLAFWTLLNLFKRKRAYWLQSSSNSKNKTYSLLCQANQVLLMPTCDHTSNTQTDPKPCFQADKYRCHLLPWLPNGAAHFRHKLLDLDFFNKTYRK